MQEMVIYGVSFDMVGKQPIVLLKTRDGNKFLPIWIGHPEAAAILMKLQGANTPRPMTHDLISEMLSELDVSCTRVAVTELRENTFYAEVTLQLNGREIPIDSRPSDALALAVRTGAPIFAAEDVISESAIEFEHEVEDTEEVVEKFKDFLDNVTPEDFAAGEEGRAVGSWGLAPPDPRRSSAGRLGRPRPRRSVSASSRIRPTSSSKPIPAASAAWGSRLVSVSPGIGFASSTVELARARRASGPRARTRGSPAAGRCAAPAPAPARSRPSGSSAGQTKLGAADLVARLEVVELVALRHRLDHRQRLAVQDRHGQVAPVHVALEQHLRVVRERRHQRRRHVRRRAGELDPERRPLARRLHHDRELQPLLDRAAAPRPPRARGTPSR